MSVVTDFILSFSIAEDEKSRVKEINLFSNKVRGFALVSADHEGEHKFAGIVNKRRWYGGSKMLGAPLFIGAYNHLDIAGLIEYLEELEWEEREHVQLILREEDESQFKIIHLDRRVQPKSKTK